MKFKKQIDSSKSFKGISTYQYICLKRNIGQLDQFYWQYLGFIIGEEKELYLHFLPKRRMRDKEDFYREFWSVCDGGPIYWGMEYSLKSKTFKNPAFNGTGFDPDECEKPINKP